MYIEVEVQSNDLPLTLQSNHKGVHKSQSNILHHIIPPKAISPDSATGFYNPFPSFPFSGPLRPVYPLSEHRTVPKSIPHPVWWQDGNPRYSRSLTNRNKIEVLDASGIEAMRKSCRLAREVLDIAAAVAKPGVTTDYIDDVVHKACIERNVSARSKIVEISLLGSSTRIPLMERSSLARGTLS